jgi:hypothetical protein
MKTRVTVARKEENSVYIARVGNRFSYCTLREHKNELRKLARRTRKWGH